MKFKLSTYDKLKIMYDYQNEFPVIIGSRLYKIIYKLYPSSTMSIAGEIQHYSVQSGIARLVLLDFSMPNDECELMNFSIKNKTKIDLFFKTAFLSLYCAKEYTESFIEVLEKNYLEKKIITKKNKIINKIKI